MFLERAAVSFDGRPAASAFEYIPSSAFNDYAQAPSKIRLTGAVPAGASNFTFTYGLALGTYALNARIGDGPVQTQWVVGGAPSAAVSLSAPLPPPTRAEIGWQYFVLGFTHILPHGFDHVLFVVGIFLLTSKWRSIVAQVSTFTIAHSITLALTMYGIVSLPAKVVEPMIALSIAYVAIENLVVSELKPWRLALVFSFGLLHGMGFAGVLRDLGLPRPAFLTALVTFNVGRRGGAVDRDRDRLRGVRLLATARSRDLSPLHRRARVVRDRPGRGVLDRAAGAGVDAWRPTSARARVASGGPSSSRGGRARLP